MDNKQHWEKVYANKPVDSVSWFQPHAVQSMKIIQRLSLDKSAHIIDVGGGASTLVDDLLAQGYSDVSVLDLSAYALQVAKERLGDTAHRVQWIEGDITQVLLPEHRFDLWHDRAVFHFLTDEAGRHRYIETVLKSVRPGGYILVATFAEDGPKQCSGLPVQRYSAGSLHAEFGSPFELLGHKKEIHQTPFGSLQKFIYCLCRVTHA